MFQAINPHHRQVQHELALVQAQAVGQRTHLLTCGIGDAKGNRVIALAVGVAAEGDVLFAVVGVFKVGHLNHLRHGFELGGTLHESVLEKLARLAVKWPLRALADRLASISGIHGRHFYLCYRNNVHVSVLFFWFNGAGMQGFQLLQGLAHHVGHIASGHLADGGLVDTSVVADGFLGQSSLQQRTDDFAGLHLRGLACAFICFCRLGPVINLLESDFVPERLRIGDEPFGCIWGNGLPLLVVGNIALRAAHAFTKGGLGYSQTLADGFN